MMKNFNTSHVTVYRGGTYASCEKTIFQYISCYCLSHVLLHRPDHPLISIHLMLLFIMAHNLTLFLSTPISIHLMLLFILHLTSFTHVFILISIHLMLLFIQTAMRSFCHVSDISIHLMLLFIGMNPNDIINKIKISIHLMLLFIKTVNLLFVRFNYFNTSHVTVYQ